MPHEPGRSWTTTALGKFWGNGSFNMTITATNAVLTKGADMNANKLVAKVATTAVVVLIPIVALSTAASAAPKPAAHTEAGTSIGLTRGAPNAWSSRLSGLPAGGAALFDGLALDGGSAFYSVPAAPAAVKQVPLTHGHLVSVACPPVAQLSTFEMVVKGATGPPLTQRVPERIGTVVVPRAERRGSPQLIGSPPVIDVRLLGRFVVTGGGRSIRSWPRPSARRLCQLVLVSPGRRVSRESACEALFPSLSPEAAARSLYKAQSMARLALKELGPQAAGLLCADPSQIWADPAVALAVDLDAHEEALRAALQASPGPGRDVSLVEVLSTGGAPLEDEPEAEWAARVRERVQYLRQEARLELARDRFRGVGRARPEEVLQAWQACLEADPTDEEAAAALMQLYVAHGRRPAAVAVYERCRAALADLGMKTSPALEEVRANADGRGPGPTGRSSPVGPGLAPFGRRRNAGW